MTDAPVQRIQPDGAEAMTELLSCPFCGQMPDFEFLEWQGVTSIWCCNENCDAGCGTSATTFEAASETWNTRALPDATAGRESFGEAYMAARAQVSESIAQEVASRNSFDEKLHRPDLETDAEFVRRIIATYLAVSSTDQRAGSGDNVSEPRHCGESERS